MAERPLNEAETVNFAAKLRQLCAELASQWPDQRCSYTG